MKTQKTPSSQINLQKEECNRRNKPSQLQTILHSYSHQEGMVLVQRQKYRSTEQKRKFGVKCTHLWTPYL